MDNCGERVMAGSFSLDMSALIRALEKSPDSVGEGSHIAMDRIKDNWVAEAVNIAPLKKKTLRGSIAGEVEGESLKSQVIVTANAVNKSKNGKRFNYGYYIHEGHMAEDGKHLQHSGTVEKFLEDSVKETKWHGWLEDEVSDALKKEGW